MFPSIEASSVGTTGLVWLFISYGYALYHASNLISEGSDLLLLVPSMSGFVGGTILPLLGAIPDGAILLFSGLGDREDASETLAVGVGALAGSTIMLLTIPWALCVIAGRVELVGPYRNPKYKGRPKLLTTDPFKTLNNTGVALTSQVHESAIVMMLTSIPYFVIQIPASIYGRLGQQNNDNQAYLAEKEHFFALAGFIICLIGFVSYLWFQVRTSQKGADKLKRIAVLKKKMSDGVVSLSGAMSQQLARAASEASLRRQQSYRAVMDGRQIPFEDREQLGELLKEAFHRYDRDHNGSLEKMELMEVLRDLNENVSEKHLDDAFRRYDHNLDGTISFSEFISCIWCTMMERIQAGDDFNLHDITTGVSFGGEDDGEDDTDGMDSIEEEEDLPGNISSLNPDQQQRVIKRQAFQQLACGAILVTLFSDPMIDVLAEISTRMSINPFYVSFVLAPLAANASEVIASQYYAAKKTRKSMTVAITALEGAAAMNNTFCLSILLGLVHFRGFTWEYTAETLAILVVECIVGFLAFRKETMTVLEAVLVLSLFPASIALVAILEAFGFD